MKSVNHDTSVSNVSTLPPAPAHVDARTVIEAVQDLRTAIEAIHYVSDDAANDAIATALRAIDRLDLAAQKAQGA